MVRNVLSLNLQEDFRVKSKIAEMDISNRQLATEKRISDIIAKSNMKNMKVTDLLFEKRNELLNENIDALFNLNPEDAKACVFKNNVLFQKYNWSFVKIDRHKLSKEEVKKVLAHNRYNNVVYEINYQRQKFIAAKMMREHQEYVDYRINYDKELEKFTSDKTPLISENYETFYNNLQNEYKNIQENAKQIIDNFKKPLFDEIKHVYECIFDRKTRQDITHLELQTIELLNQDMTLFKEIKYQEIDMYLLEGQEKEKFDVASEKKELTELLNENKKKFVENEKTLNLYLEKLNDLVNLKNDKRKADVEIKNKQDDDKLNDILLYVHEAFKEEDNKIYNKIYHKIKDYVTSLCPDFFTYFKEKEKEHDNKNKEFVENNKQNCTDANYGTDKYLVDSTNNENVNNINLKDRLHENKQNYHNAKHEIKEGIISRKNEYKEQKAAAKINLKNADGAKASEIREVLKVYKKSIKTGTLKARIKAFNKYLKGIVDAIINTNKEKKKASLSAPLYVKQEYKERSKKTNKELKDEYRNLDKEISKDLKISRYRKNFTTKSRENLLGYLFLSLWAIGFLAFTFWPIIYTFILMFTNVSFQAGAYTKVVEFSFSKGIQFPTWVGYQNIKSLFLQQVTFAYENVPQFFRSMVFYLPIVVFISFVLAMLLNSKIKGRTLFRIIYFLPVVIVSGPVINMLNSENTSGSSSIRLSLAGSGVAKVIESLSPTALKYANEVFQNFIIILWMTGVPIVLFISALQKINKQLYEAAEIDGANKWQMLWTITFPLIKSILLIVCLFTIMQIATINVGFVNPINTWINSRLRESGTNLGLVSTAAWVQTIIVLLFVLISFLLFREREFVSKDKNYEEVEEAKLKKQNRRARRRKFFHVDDTKIFFTKVFSPISKLNKKRIQKKKEKEEMGG